MILSESLHPTQLARWSYSASWDTVSLFVKGKYDKVSETKLFFWCGMLVSLGELIKLAGALAIS